MPNFTADAELPVSAPRMWQALKDSSVIVPKIAPQAVASMEQVEGPVDAVGAVRLIKLGPVAPAGAFVKDKVIALDHATFTLSTEELEGGHIFQGFAKWVNTMKFTPVSDSSCKWETSVDYEGENDTAIAESKEGMTQLFMGVAAYVNATGAYA